MTKYNHRPVSRFYCQGCGRGFSSHTRLATYRQKKPHLNRPVFELYASTLTQRRMAQLLRVNRKTIVRKFHFLSLEARRAHLQWKRSYQPKRVQFDEMESFEHTRLKPLSIALCVDEPTRQIVEVCVAKMPYRGKLAGFAYKKYGPRPDEREKSRTAVLSSLRSAAELTIVTDELSAYPKLIAKTLPQATHLAIAAPDSRKFRPEGSRKNVDDPLFAFNHTAAKIRHDLSRLLRRVWVTTKKIDRLQAHLDLYLAYHNGYRLCA